MKLPEYIQLETTTKCKTKCSFCPRSQMNRRKDATNEQITKIVNEAVSGATTICPFLMGDPCLEPRLVEILKEIKRVNPAVTTMIYTSMRDMTKKLTKDILNSSCLDELHISYYSQALQPGLKAINTSENIKDFIWTRNMFCLKKPRIIMHYLETPEQMKKYPEFVAKWGPIVDGIQIVAFDTFHGDIKFGGITKENVNKVRKPCNRLWDTLNIHADGNVVPCCIDYSQMEPMGNVNTETLLEIWNNEKFNNLRKMHTEGRQNEIELCKECNIWKYV